MRKIVFCDVDYTLAHFSHEAGIAAFNHKLAWAFDDVFQIILGGMRSGGTAFTDIISEFEYIARTQVEGEFGEPFASRELWAWRALKQLYDISSGSDSLAAAHSYWDGVNAAGRLYPDTSSFVFALRLVNARLVLVSTTDGRLCEGERLPFRYDPEFSRKEKCSRFAMMGLADLVDLEKDFVCGDPVSKPNPRFWERALRHVHATRKDKCYVVGDSYAGDIVGAAAFGTETILLDREAKYHDFTKVPLARHVVSTLKEAADIIAAS